MGAEIRALGIRKSYGGSERPGRICPDLCNVFVQRASKFDPWALEQNTGWAYEFGALDAAVGELRSPEVVKAILPLFSLARQNSFGSAPMHNIFEAGDVNMLPHGELPSYYGTNAKLLSMLFCREALALRDVNGHTPLYKACETLDAASIAKLAQASAPGLAEEDWEGLEQAAREAGKRFKLGGLAADSAAALRAARERFCLDKTAGPGPGGAAPKARGM